MSDNYGKNFGDWVDDRKREMSSETFRREYLGEFVRPDPLFTKAFQAWLSFYDQLEEFGQKICRARNPDGLAVTLSSDEIRLSNQKARLLKQELIQPLRELEIPQATENAARELAMREHDKRWKKR